jgi:hypothetical protein
MVTLKFTERRIQIINFPDGLPRKFFIASGFFN